MIDELNRYETYTVTTKYPYELGGVHKNVKLVCEIYDWRVASLIGSDVLSSHSRLRQLDSTLPPIESLTYYAFRDSNARVFVLAKEYIDDIVIANEESYTK